MMYPCRCDTSGACLSVGDGQSSSDRGHRRAVRTTAEWTETSSWWTLWTWHPRTCCQSGPLPSGVDLEAFLSGNSTQLTDDEVHRLILQSPFLLRPGSSNFDPATQVGYTQTAEPRGKGARAPALFRVKGHTTLFAPSLFMRK